MFYFFTRDQGDRATCEIRPSPSGAGYDLVVSQPGAPMRSEYYPTMADMYARWVQVQEEFAARGLVGALVHGGLRFATGG